MARIPNAPVQVTLGPDGRGGQRPVSYIFSGGRYRIAAILETFPVAKPWWLDPNYKDHGPQEEVHWRVQLEGGGMVDLVQDGQQWRLYKSWD